MHMTGKTVLLTGATGGIGGEIAQQLAAAGAQLILVGRKQATLQAQQQQLGADHHSCAADIATSEGRQALLDYCDAQQLAIDILINNAGSCTFNFLSEQSAADIQALMQINLLAPILLTQALLPRLLQRPEASIVNVGSTFGSIGYPAFSSYCASKFGLRGFTESLRRELSDSCIQVLYLAPRATATEMNSSTVNAMNKTLNNAMDAPAVVAKILLRQLQTGRSTRYIGWPEKLFVKINGLFPKIVEKSLRKQLPVIRRFTQ